MHFILYAIALAVGIGIGHALQGIKLDNIEAELEKVEASASAEVKSLVARIKALL